ncbi:hypothetical protein AWENTII_010064 [Aspergillus wentii]
MAIFRAVCYCSPAFFSLRFLDGNNQTDLAKASGAGTTRMSMTSLVWHLFPPFDRSLHAVLYGSVCSLSLDVWWSTLVAFGLAHDAMLAIHGVWIIIRGGSGYKTTKPIWANVFYSAGGRTITNGRSLQASYWLSEWRELEFFSEADRAMDSILRSDYPRSLAGYDCTVCAAGGEGGWLVGCVNLS